MTANEIELLNIIRTNSNPEHALMTAVAVILDYLKITQRGSSEEQAAADLPEPA